MDTTTAHVMLTNTETGHLDFLQVMERKWQCLICLGTAVPVAGGASSFLGITTFFSGTFFLTSGTLKTPFHDKNIVRDKKERTQEVHTQKDQHATLSSGGDVMQSGSPSVMI